jgi:hypothetical protein
MDDGVIFCSEFDSGNLSKVEKVDEDGTVGLNFLNFDSMISGCLLTDSPMLVQE